MIKKYNLDLIDLIFIDAEGYDADIVEDFFKNSLKRPVIIFEYLHVSNKKFEHLITVF